MIIELSNHDALIIAGFIHHFLPHVSQDKTSTCFRIAINNYSRQVENSNMTDEEIEDVLAEIHKNILLGLHPDFIN